MSGRSYPRRRRCGRPDRGGMTRYVGRRASPRNLAQRQQLWCSFDRRLRVQSRREISIRMRRGRTVGNDDGRASQVLIRVPDTRQAAAQLGVSQRTVQRWVQQGTPRRSTAADALNQQRGAWRNSPAGRRTSLSTRREARLRNKRTSMVFYGKVRISAELRRRGTTITVNGDRMGRILDAELAGNDQLALSHTEDTFGDAFGDSVTLVDIEQLDTFG